MITSIFSILSAVRGASFITKLVSICIAGITALAINNAVQRIKITKAERARIIEKTRKAGKKRNAKAHKIRKSIKPNDAWERLRREYSSAD